MLVSREILLCLVYTGSKAAFTLTSLSTGQTTHSLRLPEPLDFRWARFNPHPFYNSITGLNSSDWTGIRLNSQHAPVFSPDPSTDVIVLDYERRGNFLIQESRLLIISVQGLLNLFYKELPVKTATNTESNDTLVGSVYEWLDWSKSMATWLPRGMYKVSRRTAFGSKVLVSTWIPPESAWGTYDGHDNQQYLILLDFNPRARISDTENRHREALLDTIVEWSGRCTDIYAQSPGLNFRVKILQPRSTSYLGIFLHGNGFVAREVCTY